MKRVFLFVFGLLALHATITFAENKYNCTWQAEHSSNNFDSEAPLATFDSCSLFVREMLIGAQSGWLGPLGSDLMVGNEPVGTMTYIAADGSKRTCQTILKKNPEYLNSSEAIAAYLKAELDGGVLNNAGQAKAKELMQSLDVPAVLKKIDNSIELKCSDTSL